MSETITVQATINAPVQKVWEMYNTPSHVMNWNNASPDWHTPHAENDLKVGGKFTYRMASKESTDPNDGFDFSGVYDEVVENSLIKYTMSDNRKVTVSMQPEGEGTHISVTFDPETENPPEFQQQGWQAILDNFKQYVETQN